MNIQKSPQEASAFSTFPNIPLSSPNSRAEASSSWHLVSFRVCNTDPGNNSHAYHGLMNTLGFYRTPCDWYDSLGRVGRKLFKIPGRDWSPSTTLKGPRLPRAPLPPRRLSATCVAFIHYPAESIPAAPETPHRETFFHPSTSSFPVFTHRYTQRPLL